MNGKAFQASGNGTGNYTAATPRAAALDFFAANPTKRKCYVIEGEVDGHFFTVRYGPTWPQSWKDVTKAMAANLPA